MGRIYNMPEEGKSFAELGSGFNITGTNPIDNRLVVERISDISDINGVQCGAYEGMVVYVKEDSDGKPVLKMCTKVDPDEPGRALEWADVAPKIEYDTEAMHYKGSLNYENWVLSWKKVLHEYGDVWYISDEHGLTLPNILDILDRYAQSLSDPPTASTTEFERSLVWNLNGGENEPDKIHFNGTDMTGVEFLNYYLTEIKPHVTDPDFDPEAEPYKSWAEAYDELKIFKFPVVADCPFVLNTFVSRHGEYNSGDTQTAVSALEPGTMVIYTKNLGTNITHIPSVVPYYWEYVKSSNVPICDKIGFEYNGSVPAITNTDNLIIPNTTGSFKNLDDVLEKIIAKVWYTAPTLDVVSAISGKWYIGTTYSFGTNNNLNIATVNYNENSGGTNSSIKLTFNVKNNLEPQHPSVEWNLNSTSGSIVTSAPCSFKPTNFKQTSLTIAELNLDNCNYTNADGLSGIPLEIASDPKFNKSIYFKYYAKFTENELSSESIIANTDNWSEAACGASLTINVKTGTNTKFLAICIPAVFSTLLEHTNDANDSSYVVTSENLNLPDDQKPFGLDYKIWRVKSATDYSSGFNFKLIFK